ncbi:MAG: metallophosphoesterase [Verrucomicrobiota bacterium]
MKLELSNGNMRDDRWVTRRVGLPQIVALLCALSGCAAMPASAAIAVGPAGSGTLTFDTLPAASEWATSSVIGAAGSLNDDAAMDEAMSGISASSITATLATKTGSGTSGPAYWRSGDYKLGTQPTGNAMTLLMATLQNTSGSTVDALLVSYVLGLPTVAAAEQINGHRVYWSKTGAAGTWNVLGDYLLSVTAVTTTIKIPLTSLAWANGETLYVVWADDNGNSSPDNDYTLDDVSFTPFSGPMAAISGPLGGTTVGTDFMIEAIAASSSGTIDHVSFYDGATLLGIDTTPPYGFAWLGASVNGHALKAVATDSNNVAAASAVVNVTVAAGSGTLQRGPYLQKAAPNQMTICWRSTLSTLGQVRYGTSAADLNQVVNEPTLSTSPLNHGVTLTGLSPNTTYYYSIGTAVDTLASGTDCTFTTPPVPGTVMNTRIWALGDEGTGNANQKAVRDAFYTWSGTRVPNLVLQLGDNAYDYGTDADFKKGMFDIYPTMLSKTPFWSCLGNHETNQGTAFVDTFPYFDIYTLPTAGESGGVASGTEHYYSFDYANIHFISLDSMTASRSPTGAMATWLQADLASTTATWIVAFFHHPPYTKGSHDSDTEIELIEMRENILPILEAGGVDLVLCGHSHSYERSYLLDGHYGDSTTLTDAMKKDGGNGRPTGTGAYIKPLTGPRDHFGAVYAVSGSAGKISDGALNHPAHCISMNNLGSFVLDINGPRLDATFIRENNTTPDTFTILKQGTADSDHDGIPDAYEMAHGLDRFNAADAALDRDGDGASNLDEFILATAADVPDHYTFSTTYNPLAGTATVSFPTVAGRNYRVMFSPNLLGWQPASAALPGTGTTLTWTDDGSSTGTPPAGAGQRFYRIEVTVAH